MTTGVSTQYALVGQWSGRPWTEDVTGVAVDADDRVFVLTRGREPVTVLGRDGVELARWGSPEFSERPHHISVAADQTVYVADDGGHRIHHFTPSGEHLGSLGSGQPSYTGFDESQSEDPSQASATMPGGAPFNRPTKAVASPDGDVFVSDGYRNCRVHRFDPGGQLAASWGGAGSAFGAFVIPHAVGIDRRGRVLVCDRENDRVQIFDRDGALLDVWSDLQRPTDVAFDPEGNVYISELAHGPRDPRFARACASVVERPGRVSVLDGDGAIVARLHGEDPPLLAPHAVAADSEGSVYVCEVPGSFCRSRGIPARSRRCIRKFVRR